MSDTPQDPTQIQQAEGTTEDKYGKGKSRASDDSGMEEDEDEEDDYEEVRCASTACPQRTANVLQVEGEVEEPDEDNMEEIDEENIVSSRTRGKNIDFAQAAKDLEDEDDDEEDDDEDFEEEDEEMAD